HWVSARHAVPAEVRLYDRLFKVESPEAGDDDFLSLLNPDSLKILSDCQLEPALARAMPGDRFQFERLGYFSVDPKLSRPGSPVFNRTVSLKDSWAKVKGQ
ncbi:MAG TPA: glutamine--tRNA ligase, partial [Verrucomicrobiales bacterium]|nr:glutamine--tRNA ligase [Verrucomicrobiales bacterium]